MSKHISRGPWRRALVFCCAAGLAACGADSTPVEPTPVPQPGVRAVAGAVVDDTVLAQPLQALVVEVRGPDGTLAHGVTVRFDARPPADSARRAERAVYVCALSVAGCGPPLVPNGPGNDGQFASDTTDATGRAKVLVRLGTVAGTSVIAFSVPELALRDSVALTVRPGNATVLRFTLRDTAVYVGAQLQVGAAVRDRFGNARTDGVTLSSDGTVADVSPSGLATARATGRAHIVARAGGATDSVSFSVIPHARILGVRTATYPFSIVAVDLDGSNQRQLATTTGANGVYPVWAADRSAVLYHEGSGAPYLMVVDTLGGAPRRFGGANMPYTAQFPRVSRDGSRVYFQGFDYDPQNYGGQFSLWVSSISGAGAQRLGPVPGHSGYYALDPSPDGTQVVTNRGLSSSSIDVVSMPSGTVRPLGVAGSAARWSPDGQWIGYISNAPFGALAVVRPDGSGARTLTATNTCNSTSVTWSPDGAWLLCTRTGTVQLVRVSDGVVLPLAVTGLDQLDWR